MRTALGIALVVITLVLLAWAAYWVVKEARAWWAERRRVKADRETPWTHFSRYNPESNRHEVGLERVHDGQVLKRKLLHTFPPDIDSETLLDAEGHAIARAARANESREAA